MVRSIVGVIIGIAVVFSLIIGIEWIGHTLYPPPESIRAAMQSGDHDAMQAAVAAYLPTAPTGALLFPPLAWIVGTFFGGLTAAIITSRKPMLHAALVATLPLVGTIANLALIPHPAWMWAAGLIGVPLGAIAAGLLGPRGMPADPQPQDMREKNMAC
jgi:hypothetical protein